MKSIKTPSGIKRVEEVDPNAALFRLRDILNEHRRLLITRLLGDLATYIDYRFQLRPDARQIETARDSLTALKNSVLDLDKYSQIIEHFHAHDMTYIGNEPFMREIDDNLGMALNLPQLKLVE